MDIKEVYDNIAKDFSATRYKVWEGVKEFLNVIPPGSSIIETGCGNGKNLLYRDDLKCFGVDISKEMVDICKESGLDCIESNMTNIPIGNDTYDYSMSIAAIHHLNTREDRIKAINELVRVIKKNGLILIYVWCFIQPEESKRKFTKTDELVSFKKKNGEVYYRFYHLYVDGELEEDLQKVNNIEIIKIYKEKGNYVCTIKKI